MFSASSTSRLCRKDFLPSEAVAIYDLIIGLAEKEAKARQTSGKGEDGSGGRGKKKNLVGNSHKVSKEKSLAKTKAAAAGGMDRKTIGKAKVSVALGPGVATPANPCF